MKTIILFTILTVINISNCAVPWKPYAANSCDGRCGENDSSATCQCNSVCSDFGDCCSDYTSICLSCQNRCGEAYLASKPCQCNSACTSNNNCCSDYNSVCSSGGGPTDADVLALTEELYQLDQNYLVGSLITYDKNPPGPLFTNVDPSALTGPTISTFLPLRDNYVPDSSVAEVDDSQELAEKKAFLDAVMATDVMIRTEEFLSSYDLITKPLRDVIDEIFFTRYPRYGSVLGASGFEHSFMGEIDDNAVKGFHNWISFYEEEQNNNLEYTKYIDEEDISADLDLYMMGFDWLGYTKSTSSMWIGSTPELELALYTICFYYKPSALCDVSMNGVPYQVQTYPQEYNGGTYVGSAYPDIS